VFAAHQGFNACGRPRLRRNFLRLARIENGEVPSGASARTLSVASKGTAGDTA
jgi:hypothetical protein